MGSGIISLLRFLTIFKSYQISPYYVTNTKRGLWPRFGGESDPYGSGVPNLSALF